MEKLHFSSSILNLRFNRLRTGKCEKSQEMSLLAEVLWLVEIWAIFTKRELGAYFLLQIALVQKTVSRE